MSSFGIDKKEYSAYFPAAYSGCSNAAETAAAIDTSIGSAAALQLQSLAESIKENEAKDLKSQSSRPAQACAADGASVAAPPPTQIPSHEAIDKAMQELSPLFNNNLLGVANPINLDQLYGLRLEQIIDISLITLVLAIYQKNVPEKRNLKSVVATIIELNNQSWKQSASKFVQKISIFCVCSAMDENQKKSFKSILEAIKILSQSSQFYQTPYRHSLDTAVNAQNILKFTNEILSRLTQLITPQMELLLPILVQFNQKVQKCDSQVEIDDYVRLIKPLMSFIPSFIQFFKNENTPIKRLVENSSTESRTRMYWKSFDKKCKTNLFLLMEAQKYKNNMLAYLSGICPTEENTSFGYRLLTESINIQIEFFQSIVDKFLKFKNQTTPEFLEFNAFIESTMKFLVPMLCFCNIEMKNPSKDSRNRMSTSTVQNNLSKLRSDLDKKFVGYIDELNVILGGCVDAFIGNITTVFDGKNVFRMSSNQNSLFLNNKFYYKTGGIFHFLYANTRAYFAEICKSTGSQERGEDNGVNKTSFDLIIDNLRVVIKELESKKDVKNIHKTFKEHIKTFNADMSFATINPTEDTPLINPIKDLLGLLSPISQILIPIIDASKKTITLSRETQVQSVDYWLESLYDSRANEIDPLEASEDNEIVAKDTASKKKSKFKSPKKKATARDACVAVCAATTNVDKLLPKHTHHYASQSAKNFARMRWHLVEHHQLPSHVVVPNALVGKHTAIANVAFQQQIYPAECLQGILEILECSQIVKDQRLAVLSFFLYGQLFLEQSLTGIYLSQFPNKKLTHRLETLLKDLGLKGCEKWMEVNPWDTRCFRYPHASLQNNRGTIPLALWHATQLTESSTKEAKGILDQLVQEAITLQQALQKQTASNSSSETAGVIKDSIKPPEADVKEANAADLKKMNSLGLKIEKFLLPLKEVVKKMSEVTFEEKRIKNALKDVEYHLQNLHDLLGLVMRHGEQRFLFLHANIAMLSTQYLAENLGAFLSLMSGDDIRDHNLMAYQYCVDLGSKLKESDMATFQDINIRKGSEYLFQYFNNRHLSEISPRMHYLSGLYATSSMALKEREGTIIDKTKRLSLAELHEEFYKFLEPLVALATSLVNNHVLNDSVK